MANYVVSSDPDGVDHGLESKIWKEQCDAARQIEDEFGTPKATSFFSEAPFKLVEARSKASP